jgi:two-component system KDP operon response regulator KdpE
VRQFCVLLVDDEERILNFLRSKLKASGYEVLTARNGIEAIEQVQAQEPDLMVLDLIMPKMDGFETIKQLRSFSKIPVIVLSARGTDVDKIRGLELGADDYIAKPFNPDELVARIEAVRRRLEPGARRAISKLISLHGVTIDFERRRVVVGSEEVRLVRTEWLILSELTQNAGRLILYGELLTRIWGPEYRDDVQLLRTWISRLRSKINKGASRPDFIKTVPKAGYIIDQDQPSG